MYKHATHNNEIIISGDKMLMMSLATTVLP